MNPKPPKLDGCFPVFPKKRKQIKWIKKLFCLIGIHDRETIEYWEDDSSSDNYDQCKHCKKLLY